MLKPPLATPKLYEWQKNILKASSIWRQSPHFMQVRELKPFTPVKHWNQLKTPKQNLRGFTVRLWQSLLPLSQRIWHTGIFSSIPTCYLYSLPHTSGSPALELSASRDVPIAQYPKLEQPKPLHSFSTRYSRSWPQSLWVPSNSRYAKILQLGGGCVCLFVFTDVAVKKQKH